jgi:hypothetical protein
MSSAQFMIWWESFRVTGDICPLRLGMTRDELKATLGEPDDVGGTSRKYPNPAIWKYSDLEFHFELGSEGRLWLIYREFENLPQISIRPIDV